jgi:hypothetical protein
MKNLMNVEFIVVHHSAGGSGNVDIFRKEHLALNWADVGYHFVITNGRGGPDGEIQPGRDANYQGAHCPALNSKSLGVCLVGNFQPGAKLRSGQSIPLDKPTEKQLQSLIRILAAICRVEKLDPLTAIVGHREYTATDCPGDDLFKLLPEIRKQVQAVLSESPALPEDVKSLLALIQRKEKA